ncbi:MAG: hypothetical protein EZS28_042886 [Streblomastix strix]|uniref:Uncharacterized protein n=1 Tax=Streblomastix strix TaxID=222440 RepID=A0A5J4TSQ9_9EUKA|nr:MAG: hypothetical protein EZS28_042886 [Streblomastix strix]
MEKLLDGKSEEQKTSNTLWRGFYGQPLNPQQMRDMLRARIRKAGVPKCYGSITIRHFVMTALRNKRVTLEDDNKLNDHVYGSRMVNDFYNMGHQEVQLFHIHHALFCKFQNLSSQCSRTTLMLFSYKATRCFQEGMMLHLAIHSEKVRILQVQLFLYVNDLQTSLSSPPKLLHHSVLLHL